MSIQIPGYLESDITLAHFAPGDTIFEVGQPGDLMYLVKSGEVAIKIGDNVVGTIRPGEIFGEMALIDAAPRSATAIAATECTLLPINEKRFLFMIDEVPFFALQVMRIMSRRLRSADSQM